MADPAAAGSAAPGGVDAAVVAAAPGTGCRGRSVAARSAEVSGCSPRSTREFPGTFPGCPVVSWVVVPPAAIPAVPEMGTVSGSSCTWNDGSGTRSSPANTKKRD